MTRFAYTKVDSDVEEMTEVPLREQSAPALGSAPEQESPASVEASSSEPASLPSAASAAAPAPAPAPVPVPSPAPAASHSQEAPRRPAPLPVDGVFSAAVPSDIPPKYEEDYLPSYGQAIEGAVPFGNFTAVIVSSDPDVFEGRKVGSGWIFFFSMLLSWVFGVIGFLCVYLMSHTHAGRAGARSGLGLVFIQAGFWFRRMSYLNGDYFEGGQDGETDVDLEGLSLWIAYVSIFLGWFMFVRGLLDYTRVRQLARQNAAM